MPTWGGPVCKGCLCAVCKRVGKVFEGSLKHTQVAAKIKKHNSLLFLWQKAFVNAVKKNVDEVEESVITAERELGSHTIQKVLSSIPGLRQVLFIICLIFTISVRGVATLFAHTHIFTFEQKL